VKVVFDGACLADGPTTGVARAFLTGLTAYLETDGDPAILLLPRGAAAPLLRQLQQWQRLQIVEAPVGALQRQRQLPRLLRQLGASLLHSPVTAVPLAAACPTIATVHDLPWCQGAPGERTSVWRRLATHAALRRATRIIAPSSFTAHAVRRLLAGANARLRCIPHATPQRSDRPPTDPATRSGPWLAFGDARPRKNRARVLAAHRLAQQQCPDLGPLRLLGPDADYVDEATKLELLQHCRGVVQVPCFEGFGLPVLEAMAHGAPLIAADLPPLRELATGAALLVDPFDPEAIATALCRMHADAELRHRSAVAGVALATAYRPARLAAAWRALHRELCP
jgi:hypothetical protein